MIRTDCFYYRPKITENKTYPRCENHIDGFCPCENCKDYVSLTEMKRQVDIMREVRERYQNYV